MYAWQSIQRVLDYIEVNVARAHSIDELAYVAHLSPFYFQRLFARLVQRPVHEYIKMRRLARACEELEDRSKRILDIALAYGFNSHAHFTKTFKNAFGVTPSEYRARPVHLMQITKPNLLLHYTMVDEGVPLITDDMVLEITRRSIHDAEPYIGLTASVAAEQASFGGVTGISTLGELWTRFHHEKTSMDCLLPGGMELGASLAGKKGDGTFVYFAGARAQPGVPTPEGFRQWTLPAGEYVVCEFEAENASQLVSTALDRALQYLLEIWLPTKGLTTQPFAAAKYTSRADGAASMEIWVKPLPRRREGTGYAVV